MNHSDDWFAESEHIIDKFLKAVREQLHLADLVYKNETRGCQGRFDLRHDSVNGFHIYGIFPDDWAFAPRGCKNLLLARSQSDDFETDVHLTAPHLRRAQASHCPTPYTRGQTR